MWPVHGVADDAPRAEIEHVGQVEPALARRDVGDVPAGPQAGLADAEVPLDEVRERRGSHVGDRGPDFAAPAVWAWMPFSAMRRSTRLWLAQNPRSPQLVGHPRAAVGVVELVVDRRASR